MPDNSIIETIDRVFLAAAYEEDKFALLAQTVLNAKEHSSIRCALRAVARARMVGMYAGQAEDSGGLAMPTEATTPAPEPYRIADERFAGMSYKQASEEGERLLKKAAETGHWIDLPEKLIELRAIMLRHTRHD